MKKLDAIFLTENVWDNMKRPSPEISAKYQKAFDRLDKSLKENACREIEEERQRLLSVAQKSITYVIM